MADQKELTACDAGCGRPKDGDRRYCRECRARIDAKAAEEERAEIAELLGVSVDQVHRLEYLPDIKAGPAIYGIPDIKGL